VRTLNFAEFAVAARREELSDDVYAAATRAVVDWFAATVAGSVMEPALILRQALGFAEGNGTCGLVGSEGAVDPRTAALLNGTASHIAEMDDIFREGIYHPGSPTVAAALSAAQHLGLSGERLLRAVAVGYEIGDRIAAALQPRHYRFWHTTGTVGTIGAAAAVAELLELGTEPFAHALATAATNAAGLQQAFRSDAMSKPLHAGHAAEAGLTAAFAASRGFTGALDILEGPAGLGAAMSQDVDWGRAVADLGKPWAVTQATVKNHSCCGHTFAAVDAALELRAQGVRASDVETVTVQTYTTATTVAGNPDPRTEFEAKFSLSYCVAAALELGGVRLAAFSEESLRNPAIRSLVQRTTVEADPELDEGFPSRRRARVTLRLVDGATVSVTRNTRKGDPDDPLSDADLRDKFDDLVVPVLGGEATARLAEQLWSVRRAEGVSSLGASAPVGKAAPEPAGSIEERRRT
jgi:2-methylcitrate dehydratase PrpD